MNVFTDFHHAGLLNSLIMLFEGRLGGNVYRPIGMDWYEEGFWAINDHPDTARQYLSTDQEYRPKDGSPPLNLLQEAPNARMDKAEIYYCRDIDSDQVNKAITLDTFRSIPIDIVIASIPAHVEPFKRLIRQYKPDAKLIFQIGNAWAVEAEGALNVMASAIVPFVPAHINFIQYHQEFDLRIFHKAPPNNQNIITSLINVHHDMPDYLSFLELEKAMPDFKFQSYGGQGRDGSMGGSRKVAEAIQEARFIWHVKAGGDGYGHILFNVPAMARPLIVKKSYYNGKLGEKLLIDGETCIDIDGLSNSEIITKIQHYNEPERYEEMCRNAYRNFKENVNFNDEFNRIYDFLMVLK